MLEKKHDQELILNHTEKLATFEERMESLSRGIESIDRVNGELTKNLIKTNEHLDKTRELINANSIQIAKNSNSIKYLNWFVKAMLAMTILAFVAEIISKLWK